MQKLLDGLWQEHRWFHVLSLLRYAGIKNPPRQGANLLQHSVAERMLRAGLELDAVSTILRLIKLLVVIAIIAILAAMLIPVLHTVLNSSKNTPCVNNLKQSILLQLFFVGAFEDAKKAFEKGIEKEAKQRAKEKAKRKEQEATAAAEAERQRLAGLRKKVDCTPNTERYKLLEELLSLSEREAAASSISAFIVFASNAR